MWHGLSRPLRSLASVRQKRLHDKIREVETNDTMRHAKPFPSGVSRGVVNPDSWRMKRWDILMMALLVFTATVTPFEVAFLEPQFNALFWVNRLVDLLFVVDIWLNFHLAFYSVDARVWVVDRRQIAWAYAQGWLFVDVLSVLPFDTLGLLLDSSTVSRLKIFRIVRLFRLFKLLRVFRASTILRRWEELHSFSYAFLTLVKFVVWLTMVAHWMASFWRLLPDLMDETDSNWIVKYFDLQPGEDIASLSALKLYIAALYWSIMTLTTIGYGDVAPVTDAERVVVIACMIVSSSIYAYVVGAVCGIVSSMDEATGLFHRRMDTLNLFVQEANIPPALQRRLRAYFHHCRPLQRQAHFSELLPHMSPALRGEVATYRYEWVDRMPFADQACAEHDAFVIEVAMAVFPAAYGPQEFVVRIGERAHTFYVVERGLFVCSRSTQSVGKLLSYGHFFGEDFITAAGVRSYYVRSLSYSNVSCLAKADLERILDSGRFPLMRRHVRRRAISLAFGLRFVALAKAFDAARREDEMNNVQRTPAMLFGVSRLMTERQIQAHNETQETPPETWRSRKSPASSSGRKLSGSSSVGSSRGSRTPSPAAMIVRRSQVAPDLGKADGEERAAEMVSLPARPSPSAPKSPPSPVAVSVSSPAVPAPAPTVQAPTTVQAPPPAAEPDQTPVPRVPSPRKAPLQPQLSRRFSMAFDSASVLQQLDGLQGTVNRLETALDAVSQQIQDARVARSSPAMLLLMCTNMALVGLVVGLYVRDD